MKQLSLFAGVGAFELAAREHNIKTVMSVELDKYASSVLRKQFPESEIYQGDVRNVKGSDIIQKHGRIGVITAGFPCQSFSIAGKRKGFEDITRGTLFFEVSKLVDEVKPDYVLLENVKGLLNHEGGKTLAIIFSRLDELGYDCEWQVCNSKYFGVPQNRERIFIVGHTRKRSTRQIFPIRATEGNTRETITGIEKYPINNIDSSYYKGVDKHAQRTVIIDNKTLFPAEYEECQDCGDIWCKYCNMHHADCTCFGISSEITDGRLRLCTPLECERLQSFPDNWTKIGVDQANNIFEMSDTQRYKQMGNSITVNVLREIYKRLK